MCFLIPFVQKSLLIVVSFGGHQAFHRPNFSRPKRHIFAVQPEVPKVKHKTMCQRNFWTNKNLKWKNIKLSTKNIQKQQFFGVPGKVRFPKSFIVVGRLSAKGLLIQKTGFWMCRMWRFCYSAGKKHPLEYQNNKWLQTHPCGPWVPFFKKDVIQVKWSEVRLVYHSSSDLYQKTKWSKW